MLMFRSVNISDIMYRELFSGSPHATVNGGGRGRFLCFGSRSGQTNIWKASDTSNVGMTYHFYNARCILHNVKVYTFFYYLTTAECTFPYCQITIISDFIFKLSVHICTTLASSVLQ